MGHLRALATLAFMSLVIPGHAQGQTIELVGTEILRLDELVEKSDLIVISQVTELSWVKGEMLLSFSPKNQVVLKGQPEPKLSVVVSPGLAGASKGMVFLAFLKKAGPKNQDKWLAIDHAGKPAQYMIIAGVDGFKDAMVFLPKDEVPLVMIVEGIKDLLGKAQ